jgi:hypothetical protein
LHSATETERSQGRIIELAGNRNSFVGLKSSDGRDGSRACRAIRRPDVVACGVESRLCAFDRVVWMLG